MTWIAFEDKQHPGDWRVEAIDEGEGDIFVAVFSGPGSRERAEEYAVLKNAQRRAERAEDCKKWHAETGGGYGPHV